MTPSTRHWQLKKAWNELGWEQRAAIFLKAADLLAGPYRDVINAATMIGQSKNVHQAEIDSACEFIDFLRFNVEFMTEMYSEQPVSDRNLEPCRIQTIGRILFCSNSIQLYSDFRKPSYLYGNAWKRSGLEAF
jgi:acyl-CoA reductase-like NAD-dependent aldehyde dehydrogenase